MLAQGLEPIAVARVGLFIKVSPVALLLPVLLSAVDLRPQEAPAGSGIRCVVMERDDVDPAAWQAIRAVGANLVAKAAPPSVETDRVAGLAGLSYLALLTTDEIQSLAGDPARLAELRGERNLAGFYYWDINAVEGFTAPQVQQAAYTTLKTLFPDKLVLHPTRLDPIASSPGFLDGYFRPEFTDLVTPYFYPIGATPLGPFHEQDPWQAQLSALLGALAARVPAGKDVLPVLQGFESPGYPLTAGFPAAQFQVYRRFWPRLASAAVEGWEFTDLEPLLAGLSIRPALQEGVCGLFAGLRDRPARCGLRRMMPFR
jgi:hypothetical protein